MFHHSGSNGYSTLHLPPKIHFHSQMFRYGPLSLRSVVLTDRKRTVCFWASLHFCSITNFVTSWLKWLQMISNDSKWLHLTYWTHRSSFGLIFSQKATKLSILWTCNALKNRPVLFLYPVEDSAAESHFGCQIDPIFQISDLYLHWVSVVHKPWDSIVCNFINLVTLLHTSVSLDLSVDLMRASQWSIFYDLIRKITFFNKTWQNWIVSRGCMGCWV